MALDREPIFVRLFERLAAIPGLRTSDRKFRPLSEVPEIEQPALFLAMGPQTAKNRKGLPPIWTLQAVVYLYAKNEDPKAAPSTQLNALIKAVEECLELSAAELKALEQDPSISDAQFHEITANNYGTTLGGLCSHAYIAGTIETDEGILGDQAAAAIPIEIVTA